MKLITDGTDDRPGTVRAGSHATRQAGPSRCEQTRARVSVAGCAIVAAVAAGVFVAGCGDATPTPTEPPLPVATTITLSPVEAALYALDQTVRFTATVLDQNGQEMSAVVEWSSGDESVVTVDASGLTTAAGGGEAVVTASVGAVGAEAAVTVEQRTRVVRVSPDKATLFAVGDTVRLTAAAFDVNWHDVAGAVFEWSSGDESVVTVDDDGLVTAVGHGTTQVQAAWGQDTVGVSIRVSFMGERAVLEALYHNTGGPNWARSDNWLSARPLGDWHGIRTDAEGRVVAVHLAFNVLEGSIPPELGYLDALSSLDLEGNGGLAGPIPAELAALASLQDLSLNSSSLEGRIPPELGRMAKLRSLHVSHTKLEGPIPPELAGLASLSYLQLAYNKLEGRIPPELGDLTNLRYLELQGNDLSGPVPPELGQLSQLEWLDLSGNRLTGEIPPELGDLRSLGVLLLDFNRLTGEIPPELGNLSKLFQMSLRSLYYQEYRLSGPIPPELGKLTDLVWLNLDGHNLTGEIPQELANLSKLEELNLSFNELTGVLPSGVGDLSHLRVLSLSKNRLSGPIPPELGRLSELSKLNLWANRFEGPLPRELGNLTKLTHLSLSQNPLLSGPIPVEFTNLELTSFYWDESKLCSPPGPAFQRWLDGIGRLLGGPPCYAVALTALYDSAGGEGWVNAANWGTGAPLSAWHGVTADDAGRVTGLDLRGNGLTGRVPPDLGVLGDLKHLDLADNALGGAVPAELGDLGVLERLDLSGNRLEGPLPVELGDLAGLRELQLGRNRFEGALPGTLVRLSELSAFGWRDSGLCASPAAWFQEWLGGIASYAGGSACALPVRLGVAAAHVNQAAQDLEGTVPLIAGRPGLVRVYATADAANELRPEARARFFVDGREVHSAVLELRSDRGLPQDAVSGDPDQYLRARIPGDVLVPGVEMVVDLDPDGTLPKAAGSVVRHPERGRLALDVRELPPWEMTVVPVLTGENSDREVLDWTSGMGPGHPAFDYVVNMLPVGRHAAQVREPFVRSAGPLKDLRDWVALLTEIELLRATDGGSATYYGVVSGAGREVIWGMAGNGDAAVGVPDMGTMAHEIGHTMSLGHANCGLFGWGDPLFPNGEGLIGVWGYDARGDTLVPPDIPDVMSYCDPAWISDYHFRNAMTHRLEKERAAPDVAASRTATARAPRLLLWGGADEDGELNLDPAFVLDMPAQLPVGPGPHRLEGFGPNGRTEFSFDFAMEQLAHGGASFLFAIPYEEEWGASLARIVLSGPEGQVELTADGSDPVALVLDRNTGRLRAVLRGDDALAASAAADGTGAGAPPASTRTLVSFGVPRDR